MTVRPEDRVEDAGQPFRIGPYTVLRRIGRGAMGVVYSAYDEQLDRKIALKHLRATTQEQGSLGQSRLLREAQALARVSHPNVVQVYEVGSHEREVYIAMEFVRGRTLREWSRSGARPWRELLAVYMQAGRGLAAAHAAGLVHRDFKPDNVMLGDDGRVRVMDFGLARALDEPGALQQAPSPHSSHDLSLSLTAAGRIVGTPAYMAPEQYIGGVTDARTDQFAYCIALYDGLYGQRPFAGDDLRSLTTSVTHGRMREPSRRLVPRWLRRIVVRGLAVDPARRWPSMQALLVEVERGQAQAHRKGVAAALAGLGVVGLAAWGWHEHTLRTRADTCAAAGASIDEVWNDAARERMRGAFAATGIGHAPTTADKVVPWIDRQANAWSAARTAVCMEAASGSLDPVLHDRSSWCLDERRMALESLVGELSRPDVAMVQRGVAVAAALEPVSQCRDAWLLAQLPVPPEAGRAALRAVQAELLRAGNLQSAARYDDGLALARASLSEAEELAWPPLIAAARLRVGALLGKQGKQLPLAESTVEAAYFEAAAAGATGVQADAAIELVHIVGERLARPADGQRWGKLAEVTLRTLEPQPGLRTGNRLSNQANVHRLAGEYDEALALHEQALALREAALDPMHPDVAISINNLANISFTMAAYPKARALHERALAIRQQALGPDHPDVASSLNNLSLIRLRAGAPAEALVLQRQALAIRERTLGPDHLDVANSLQNLAAMYDAAGEKLAAKAACERALAIQERALGPDHPVVATTLSSLAIVQEALGATSEARTLHERALAIQERTLGPEHPNVADSLSDLALFHAGLGHHEESRALHERALAIREQALGPQHPDIAASLQYLAAIHRELGAYEKVEALATRALAIQEVALGPEHADLVALLEDLAAAALATSRPAEAVRRADRGLALAEAGTEAAARLQFLLAQALWDAPPADGRDRVPAREVAASARDAYRAATGQPGQPSQPSQAGQASQASKVAQELAAIDAWLAKHPVGA